MRNNMVRKTTSADAVRNAIKTLPFFTLEDLFVVGLSAKYLKVLLYRMVKNGEIIRLKKGIYVSKFYIDKMEKEGNINTYLEFTAVNIYESAYLSAEYILSKYGVLTENVQIFTATSKNKTKKFLNDFGIFNYRHIKDDLFTGFEIFKKSGFIIKKATLAKALFDFLYLRKNIIEDKSAFSALRLNLENLRNEDLKEFKEFIEIEGSKKMKKILSYLWEQKK